MKKRGVQILAFILILTSSKPIYADTAGAAAAIALAGGLIGVSYFAVSSGILHELPDWADSESQSTAELAQECGMKVDLRLIGNNAYNFLLFVIKNDRTSPVLFPYDHVRFDFNTGISRLPSLNYNWSPGLLNVGQTWSGLLLFPSKEDFRGAERLIVTVPISDVQSKKTCNVVATFSRNPNVPQEESSFKSYTTGELRFGIGGALARSGAQKTLATSSLNAELSFKVYPKEHWGILLAIHFDDLGNSDPVAFAPATGSSSVNPQPLLVHFVMGASYRAFFYERWVASYDLGPGLVLSSINQSGTSDSKTNLFFSIYQRLNLAYTLIRVREGAMRGDYNLGVTVYDVWMPPGTNISSVSFGGNNLGLLGYISFGF